MGGCCFSRCIRLIKGKGQDNETGDKDAVELQKNKDNVYNEDANTDVPKANSEEIVENRTSIVNENAIDYEESQPKADHSSEHSECDPPSFHDENEPKLPKDSQSSEFSETSFGSFREIKAMLTNARWKEMQPCVSDSLKAQGGSRVQSTMGKSMSLDLESSKDEDEHDQVFVSGTSGFNFNVIPATSVEDDTDSITGEDETKLGIPPESVGCKDDEVDRQIHTEETSSTNSCKSNDSLDTDDLGSQLLNQPLEDIVEEDEDVLNHSDCVESKQSHLRDEEKDCKDDTKAQKRNPKLRQQPLESRPISVELVPEKMHKTAIFTHIEPNEEHV